ncbi:DUF6301 family protein [Streptomyces sp. A0642]|uniref:DUF6301 family protein n=1 Tax=Streptomyces sp. A0642 TaxID=2563100 RepID=UPI001F10CBFD|nr:DUF6301 family protein [Streptomyces sp. A0642]
MAELAFVLQTLDCTWELRATESARRSTRFARRALMIRPRWDLLDTGFERVGHDATRRGRVRDDELVERVQLRLTDRGGQWTEVLDAFAGMAAALRTSLGEPTDRKPGPEAAVHWTGADTTLILGHWGGSVYLELVTNKQLSLDEELRRMDEDEEGPL